MTTPLEEILRIEDDTEFALGIVRYVNDEQIARGFDALTDIEKVVLLANDCEYRMVRGGITDVLLNPDRAWRDAMIHAAAEVGAVESARILRAGAKLFNAVPAEAKKGATTIGEECALAGKDQLEALDHELCGGDCDAEMHRQLDDYIVRNRSGFLLR